MNAIFRNTMAIIGLAIATQATAQVTFYEYEGFQGRALTTQKEIGSFEYYGLENGASSVVVSSDQWEVCVGNRFRGKCAVLRPGQYPSLAAMGLNDSISSVRIANWGDGSQDDRYAPPPVVAYDYRRRHNEQLYQAAVISVRAVVGPPDQRCWVEREQVVQDKSKANVPGAIFGAVIGGILGHQIGGGSGKDLATAGGVVAGAAVGANIGRDGNGQEAASRDVQRCSSVPSQAAPDYWDVIYTFRGRQYSVQLTYPPGATVTVNSRGEPRA